MLILERTMTILEAYIAMSVIFTVLICLLFKGASGEYPKKRKGHDKEEKNEYI